MSSATATRRCPHCGASNASWRRSCETCGKPLSGAADEQDNDATRPFVPTTPPPGDDAQRTEAFRPASEPRPWDDEETWSTPSWQATQPVSGARTTTTASTTPQVRAHAPTGHGVVLGCIALVLIGLVAAAVFWLTYIGPEIPDWLSP